MHSELKQLLQILALKKTTEVRHLTFYECRNEKGTEVILTECGVGKVNAALGAVEMIRSYQPDAIISTGVAGGIDQSLHVMDIVISTRLVYHDVFCGFDKDNKPGQVQGLPLYFEGAESIIDKIRPLYAEHHIREGLICTGDQFIQDKDALLKIKQQEPDGLAVDMESCAIAQTCYLYDVPFVSLRIISDIPGVDNHLDSYINFWQTMAEKSFNATRQILALL